MKFKRTVRLTAIILALAMMPLWILSCGRLDSKISSRMTELLEGTGKVSTKTASGQLYIAEIDAEASNANGTIQPTGIWPAAAITNEDSVAVAHYRKIYALTKAWATKGSAYYHKRSVLKNIKLALETGYTTYYGTPVSSASQRKWTETERANIAEFLLNTLLILDEHNKLSNKNIKKYAEILEIKIPYTFGSAVHEDRCLYIMIGTAALMEDTDRIKDISEKYLSSSYAYVSDGDGLYKDGSYIAENGVASSGSYGVTAFSRLTSILYAINGTAGDLSDNEAAKQFLYEWAVKSIIPSIYNGSAISTVTGSYIAESDKMGGEAVSALLTLSKLLDNEKANEIKAIVKAYSSSENKTFIPYLTGYGICEFQNIESNNKLIGKTISGSYAFSAMDKLITVGTKYSASLSLSSVRSSKFETRPIGIGTNEELYGAVNAQGWFSGDGMLLVYNPYYQTSDTYWKYVNYGRLPGTTVDSRTRNSYDAGGYNGISSYAGFAVNGDFAVAANAMYNNNNEYVSDLTAKKSWFIFDEEIVCLGAGITNTSVSTKANTTNPQTIESVIENIFYGDNTAIILSADLDDPNNELKPNSSFSTLTNSSLYFSKYGGIYVPTNKNDTLKARLSKTSGGNFIELWFDHGATPSDATYEYAILPGAMISDFFEYTSNENYRVLSNTEKLQAVMDISSGAYGYTFWEAAATVNDYEIIKGADFACTVLVKEDSTSITISIADFTHNALENRAGQTLTISGTHTVIIADNGITLNGNTITVDRTVAADGQTLTIVLSK